MKILKRKTARPNPWQRDPKESSYTLDGNKNILNYGWEQRAYEDFNIMEKYGLKELRFHTIGQNEYLDIYTKRAVLKASAVVVSVVSYSDEKEIFHGSGTIIESDGNIGIILTSASLIGCPTEKNVVTDNVKVVVYLSDGKLHEAQILAYDFHYNIAAIKIQSNVPLPNANLRRLDDSISIGANELGLLEEKAFQLRPHSNSFNLIPGDTVIALGRYFIKPYDIMAAPGEFSANRCDDYDCQELFKAECKITKCGSGGPLINRFGEVIGVTFYEAFFTPFMPINVACKWWEHCKKNQEPRRLWHGMEAANLYVADLHILEKITQNFPNIFKGVFVEEVMQGSPADSAGILPDDVIIQCDGKAVQSFLEFFEIMWDKAGVPVELVVIRASADKNPLYLNMVAVEPKPDKFNRVHLRSVYLRNACSTTRCISSLIYGCVGHTGDWNASVGRILEINFGRDKSQFYVDGAVV